MSIPDYPCYIKVGDEDSCEFMELPTECDGTILLSTIQAQFPSAIGLRYKTESGGWRGMRLAENCLDPPLEGWGENEYFVTYNKQDSVNKRKLEESPKKNKLVKTSAGADLLSDLIVLGLTYSATEDELKEYFEQFGELALHEIKRDPQTLKSKGFGFIRYKSTDAAQAVLKTEHNVAGRRCEVRLPKKRDEKPLKLFIGRLKPGTTTEDLREHFSKYGGLKDVYIPNDFRGFGFVTFESQEVAREVMNDVHIIQESCVNVTYAEPKGKNDKSLQENNNPQVQTGSNNLQRIGVGYGNSYWNS